MDYDSESNAFAKPVCYDCLPVHSDDCERALAGFSVAKPPPCSCRRSFYLRTKPEVVPLDPTASHAEYPTPESLEDPVNQRLSHFGGVTYTRRNGDEVTVSTVLTSDSQLHGLEFEFYVRPMLNLKSLKAWQEEQVKAEAEAREVDATLRKVLLPTYYWIQEIDKLSTDLIVQHASGSWDGLVDWQVDFQCALDKLTLIERNVVNEFRKGYSEEEVATRLGMHEWFVIGQLKSSNRTLRKWMKLSLSR